MPRVQSGFLVIVHVQENVSECLRILLATLLTRGCHRVCVPLSWNRSFPVHLRLCFLTISKSMDWIQAATSSLPLWSLLSSCFSVF